MPFEVLLDNIHTDMASLVFAYKASTRVM